MGERYVAWFEDKCLSERHRVTLAEVVAELRSWGASPEGHYYFRIEVHDAQDQVVRIIRDEELRRLLEAQKR